ncbi:hypothetical protein Taro_037174 [Colocasia esculenta]|uniref:Tim10-like domain-containing protein n=1 Tax=Colocasia esculenta TaxID=4460 RepID=A0A843WK15_COLES|nr:hypothetical protein [Colocasia esculenta]
MSGGIRDVHAKDITAVNTESGVRIRTAISRSNYIKDIYVRGFEMFTMKYAFWMSSNGSNHPKTWVTWQLLWQERSGEGTGWLEIHHIGEYRTTVSKPTPSTNKSFLSCYGRKDLQETWETVSYHAYRGFLPLTSRTRGSAGVACGGSPSRRQLASQGQHLLPCGDWRALCGPGQTVRSKCFAKCITKPGSSLSGSESSCISRCVERYIEATGIVGRALFSSTR